jgi:hypothetical protein
MTVIFYGVICRSALARDSLLSDIDAQLTDRNRGQARSYSAWSISRQHVGYLPPIASFRKPGAM